MGLKIFYLAVIAFVFSCTIDDENLSPDPLNPNEKTFKSTILVEVIDREGQGIPDVELRIGSLKAKTNLDGVVYWNNINVTSSTYIIAEKDGYFHGSRRMYPVEGQSAQARIMLLENSNKAVLNTENRLSIQFGTMVFTFKPNSITTKNGEAYNGDFILAYQHISAGDDDLASKMPGDLTGKNAEGVIGQLSTYGMFSAEIRTPDGELLQIKEGLPVRVQMAIPANMANSAPATIPLWYFDEENGIWIEEGSAELYGDRYTGEVAHFSTWNCDIWFERVSWTTTVFLADGTPATNLQVCLHIPSLNAITCGLSNQSGTVIIYTAKDQPLDLKINNACHDVLYADQVGPFSSHTVFPSITLPPQNDIQVIQGTAVNCNNDPITSGYAKLRNERYQRFADIQNANGEFMFTVANCDELTSYLTVFDNQENTRSEVQEHTFAETIDAGQVMVCLENEEYIKLLIQGVNGNLSFPMPSIFIGQQGTYIYSNAHLDSLEYFNFSFDKFEAGSYDLEHIFVRILLPDGSAASKPTDVTADITYYGPIGDYVQGTLQGWIEVEPPSVNAGIVPFQASFRVLQD